MNILQVSTTDLPGRRFNGYDLHISLNKLGYNAKHIVIEKKSNSDTVISLLSNSELFIRNQLIQLEKSLNMKAMIYPYAKKLISCEAFKQADIIHYHLVKNAFLSINDFNELFSMKKTIVTIHDPWIFTGHCVHPLECPKWKYGCNNCEHLNRIFSLNMDKSSQLWEIKKKALHELMPHIVVSSDFMINYINNTPFINNMPNIVKIPFGVELKACTQDIKNEAKISFGINANNFVIGFRNDINPIKGNYYIESALKSIKKFNDISIITVGSGKLPKEIKEKFNVIELGWINNTDAMERFYNAMDVFLMPSLAETFGMMAIEAMAHMCCVIVFKNTLLEEITFSPRCGISVEYGSDIELRRAIERIYEDKDQLQVRGLLGREIVKKYYQYSEYVNNHVSLYNKVFSEN